ncbi:siderophore ferric iron reductase [Vibrio lamellibrachiae]
MSSELPQDLSQHQTHNQLFEYSKQITPYLSGKLEALPENPKTHGILHFDYECSELIRKLYDELAEQNPEAGSAYWLTRTWDLLCWQPVYLSFVSIYACHALPDIKKIAQFVQSGFIAGYQFELPDHIHGVETHLIESAGQQLQELFNFYRSEMSEWTRIRPGFTNRLFADGLLSCIIKLQAFVPELPNQYLLEQAKLWLRACNLPEKLLQSLSVDSESNQLKLVRTSCCLVYKCEGRKLCADCPREPKNKKLIIR